MHLKGIEFDVLIASYIINPSEAIDDLATIAKIMDTIIVQSDEAVYGKGAKRKIAEARSS